MDAPALALRGVRKSLGGGLFGPRRTVLHDLDLEVAPGETLALAGPNGAGKSTLLRILAGIDAPSAGTVRVLGGSLADAAIRRRIGYLPEDSPFPPEMRAGETLELIGGLGGGARRDVRAQANAMLERVGLASVAKRPLRTFSRGMLRRFGLAQAFLLTPAVVLLDEASAGLDAPGQLVLRELLEESRTRGATTIACSHDPADLATTVDRVGILVGGRLAVVGTPTELAHELESVRLELTGNAAALARVEAEAVAAGIDVSERGPGRAALLELYRRHAGA